MNQPVFMIGWEYPPHNSGGLGEACRGMTEALAGQGQQLYFTLPYKAPTGASHMQVMECFDDAWFAQGQSTFAPPFGVYESIRPMVVPAKIDAHELRALPQSELEHRVTEYAGKVAAAADQVAGFGLIHAHDWMAFPAAAALKEQTGKPVVAHIHSTEFDRIPHGTGSQYIMSAEREGLALADRVIAVSEYTKRLIVKKYQIDPRKIDVVYNGIDPLPLQKVAKPQFAGNRPVVVFMGRLTMQKGGEYFLDIARAVLKKVPDALFVVAGHGDQYSSLLLRAAAEHLSAKVLFTGFLRGRSRDALLERADVFVMPSLSEPFGLVALEAAQRRTPVIVSKTSGVAEVLPSALQADFWDTTLMVDQIVSLLSSPREAQQQVAEQLQDVKQVTWQHAAERIHQSYMRAFQSR